MIIIIMIIIIIIIIIIISKQRWVTMSDLMCGSEGSGETNNKHFSNSGYYTHLLRVTFPRNQRLFTHGLLLFAKQNMQRGSTKWIVAASLQ